MRQSITSRQGKCNSFSENPMDFYGVTTQISFRSDRCRSLKSNNQIPFLFTHLEKVWRNYGGSSPDEPLPATCKVTHVSMPGNVIKHSKYYTTVSFYILPLIRVFVTVGGENDNRETHAHTDTYRPTLFKWPTELIYFLFFFKLHSGRGESKLGPLDTSATKWLIVSAPGDYDDGEFGGMKIGRGNRSSRRKPAPAPLCLPQIPLDETRARTRAAAVAKSSHIHCVCNDPRHTWPSTYHHSHIKMALETLHFFNLFVCLFILCMCNV
jgi:hypothetical protein